MKKTNKEVLKQIKQLFECASKHQSMGKRYVQLARKMAMKFNIKIPKELKKRYCHHCYTYFAPKNCKVRIKKGMKIVECLKCGYYNRSRL